jgi:hypothetical protein
MKKSLLATTAIAALGAVAVATPASAQFEVSVSGYMEQWFGYSDSNASVQPNTDAFAQHSDNEFYIGFKQTLDNGLEFSGRMEVEGENANAGIDEQWLRVTGSFGELTLGSENNVGYLMHYATPSRGIGTEENDATAWIPGSNGNINRTNLHTAIDNDANSVSYISPRINGFQVGATFTPSIANVDQRVVVANNNADGNRDNSWSVAGNYVANMNDVNFMLSAGFTDAGTDSAAAAAGDREALTAGIRVGFGGFTVAFAYGEHEDDSANAGAGSDQNVFATSLSYAAGPAGVSLTYVRGEDSDTDEQQDVIEVGASYAVGPGISARSSIYYADNSLAGVDQAEGVAVAAGLRLDF